MAREAAAAYHDGMISFRITGLRAEPFIPLFGRSDRDLAALGAKRYIVDRHPGFPDRISMRDLQIGERAILVNYEHQSASTPYRSTHAIFVGEGVTQTYNRVGEIPEVVRTRLLSLRAFDCNNMMVDADVRDGEQIESLIERLFANPETAYIHIHNAKPGCYSGRIDRA